ncbi:hypothetical protein TNCV_2616211 [Trichonephila clavipes]|nr:hypothetical protein TNCV_2616211 [Trichonephila clavipes]
MVEVKPINLSLNQHSNVLCKKANGAMKKSSVEFISRSPNPSPMERNYRRFVLLEGSSSPGSGSEGKEKSF